MLPVSLQPTPLRCTRNVVPTGPRATSSDRAVGAIQNAPCFLVPPASTQRLCTPPRSSGATKRKAARPAASACAWAITRDCSPQPAPVMRLPTTVLQLSAYVLPAANPAPLTTTGCPTPEKTGLATSSPGDGSERTSRCACASAGGGSTGGPGVIVKPSLNCGRSGTGD